MKIVVHQDGRDINNQCHKILIVTSGDYDHLLCVLMDTCEPVADVFDEDFESGA